MAKKETWTFLESSEFQKSRASFLSDVEFEAVKELLPRHPGKWIQLKNGPGVFALHWGVQAPCTIVFCVAPDTHKIYLLGVQTGTQHSLSAEAAKALPRAIKKAQGRWSQNRSVGRREGSVCLAG